MRVAPNSSKIFIQGWYPPWVFFSEEHEPHVIFLLKATSGLNDLFTADHGIATSVTTYTQMYPLKLTAKLIERKTLFGALIMRDSEIFSRVSPINKPLQVSCKIFGEVSPNFAIDPLLAKDLDQSIIDLWKKRQQCDHVGCKELLPVGIFNDKCRDHKINEISDARKQLLHEIEVLKQKFLLAERDHLSFCSEVIEVESRYLAPADKYDDHDYRSYTGDTSHTLWRRGLPTKKSKHSHKGPKCFRCGHTNFRMYFHITGMYGREESYALCESCQMKYGGDSSETYTHLKNNKPNINNLMTEPGAINQRAHILWPSYGGDGPIHLQSLHRIFTASPFGDVASIFKHSIKTLDYHANIFSWLDSFSVGEKIFSSAQKREIKIKTNKKKIIEAKRALQNAIELSGTNPDFGTVDSADDEKCKKCGWPFQPKHRYSGGKSCEVLEVITKCSTGEWIRLPKSGKGIRKMVKAWENKTYGPVTFGRSRQYGIDFGYGTILKPILDRETAAITFARIKLYAIQEKVDLSQAYSEILLGETKES